MRRLRRLNTFNTANSDRAADAGSIRSHATEMVGAHNSRPGGLAIARPEPAPGERWPSTPD